MHLKPASNTAKCAKLKHLSQTYYGKPLATRVKVSLGFAPSFLTFSKTLFLLPFSFGFSRDKILKLFLKNQCHQKNWE
jgi:hypothetical protein